MLKIALRCRECHSCNSWSVMSFSGFTTGLADGERSGASSTAIGAGEVGGGSVDSVGTEADEGLVGCGVIFGNSGVEEFDIDFVYEDVDGCEESRLSAWTVDVFDLNGRAVDHDEGTLAGTRIKPI